MLLSWTAPFDTCSGERSALRSSGMRNKVTGFKLFLFRTHGSSHYIHLDTDAAFDVQRSPRPFRPRRTATALEDASSVDTKPDRRGRDSARSSVFVQADSRQPMAHRTTLPGRSEWLRQCTCVGSRDDRSALGLDPSRH